jgi:hypothetical protein
VLVQQTFPRVRAYARNRLTGQAEYYAAWRYGCHSEAVRSRGYRSDSALCQAQEARAILLVAPTGPVSFSESNSAMPAPSIARVPAMRPI